MKQYEGNISIEQFAAFLDGNLSEKEMQDVADMIDSDNMYADVVSTTIEVDNAIEDFINAAISIPDELQNMDFEVPVIPSVDTLMEDIEVLPVQDTQDVVVVEPGESNTASSSGAEDGSDPMLLGTASTTSFPHIAEAEDHDSYASASDSIYEEDINTPETIDIV